MPSLSTAAIMLVCCAKCLIDSVEIARASEMSTMSSSTTMNLRGLRTMLSKLTMQDSIISIQSSSKCFLRSLRLSLNSGRDARRRRRKAA